MTSPISPKVTKEYTNDEQLHKFDVEYILDWAKDQLHLPNITEFEVICFLKKCLYQDAPTRSTIDDFYTAKNMWDHLFLDTTILDPLVFEVTDYILVTILPEETPENRSIIYVKFLCETEPPERPTPKLIKYIDSVLMLDLYQHGTKKGYVFLLDATGVDEEKFQNLEIDLLKEFFYYLEELMPIAIEEIHFLNTENFSEEIFWQMQSCLPKALLPKVYGHRDLESLVEYIPSECLPDEYDGDSPSIEKLKAKNIKKLQRHRDFFEWELKQKTNEAERGNNVVTLVDII